MNQKLRLKKSFISVLVSRGFSNKYTNVEQHSTIKSLTWSHSCLLMSKCIGWQNGSPRRPRQMRGSTFMNNTWLLVTLSLPPQAACIQDFIPQSGKHCFYSHSTGQNSDIWLNVTRAAGRHSQALCPGRRGNGFA